MISNNKDQLLSVEVSDVWFGSYESLNFHLCILKQQAQRDDDIVFCYS